jgi:hypothetical protein
MSSKIKSRNLSIYEYFQILQIEWLSADLRSRIYPRKDQQYWDKVKQGKEQVVNKIAEKNHLPTIFTDEEMKRIFELKLFGVEGFPKFSYRDEENEARQKPFDLIYYYSKGAEVRVQVYGEIKVATIKSYQPYATTIILTLDEQLYTADITSVTRIL